MDNYFPSLNKFLTSKIGAFFIILPFVKPAPELTGSFDVIFDIWKLFAASLILVGCIRTLHKASHILYWIAGLQVVMLLSTIIHNADFKAAIVQVVSVISICIYFDYFIRTDPNRAISTLMLPLIFMSIMTAISMFVFYPEGMYVVGDELSGEVVKNNFLWGFDNSSIFNFIPGMYLLGLYALIENNKIIYRKTIFVLLFISLAFLYVFSITAFIGCFSILLAFVFILVIKKKANLLTTKNLIILAVVLSLVLLIFNDRLSILMEFSKLTDKFYSIKARFIIWDCVINWWKKSPLIGYGIEDKLLIIGKLNLDHPHNYFMDVLYRSGLIGIVVVVVLFYKLISGKWSDSHINAFSAVAFFVLLVIAQFDFYNDHYMFYPIMIVVMYSKNLVITKTNKSELDNLQIYESSK